MCRLSARGQRSGESDVRRGITLKNWSVFVQSSSDSGAKNIPSCLYPHYGTVVVCPVIFRTSSSDWLSCTRILRQPRFKTFLIPRGIKFKIKRTNHKYLDWTWSSHQQRHADPLVWFSLTIKTNASVLAISHKWWMVKCFLHFNVMLRTRKGNSFLGALTSWGVSDAFHSDVSRLVGLDHRAVVGSSSLALDSLSWTP